MRAGHTMLLMQDLQQSTAGNWGDQLEALHKHTTVSFMSWFKKNWIGDRWEMVWCDINRWGWREGMWNMNNATEALFKWVMYHFFNQHHANSIAVAMDVWQCVMKAFETKFEQILNSSVPMLHSTTTYNMKQR
jgi:hypothetical protein